jgi:hypothetical protein
LFNFTNFIISAEHSDDESDPLLFHHSHHSRRSDRYSIEDTREFYSPMNSPEGKLYIDLLHQLVSEITHGWAQYLGLLPAVKVEISV